MYFVHLQATKGAYTISGYSFSISLLLCLVHQKVTSHVQKSIYFKIMPLVGSFSHFCPLQCFSLLKVQIVFSKCSYSIFCCQWSSNLFPATRSYHHNPSGILAALTNCNQVFPIVLRLSLRNSISGLISQLILKLPANQAMVNYCEWAGKGRTQSCYISVQMQ